VSGPGRHRRGGGGPAPEARAGRLTEIDLLRITAASAVVLYHYTFSGWAGHLTSLRFTDLSVVTRYGYLGVDLFFLISGFVVLLSAWNRRPREFVVSRMVRLYPAFWVAVTITAVVEITLSRGLFKVSVPQYLANLTMANSLPNIRNVDVVYWTLWAEIRFYVIVFVLTWIGVNRRRVLTLMWGWLAATAVIEAHVLPAGVAEKVDLLVQSQWSHYFIGGMALCLIYRTGLSWAPAVILVLCFGNALYQAANFSDLVSDRYHQVLHVPVVLAIISMIFVVLTLVALRVTRRLGRPWFAALGALTYPLYLVHAYSGFTLFNVFAGQARRLGQLGPWLLLAGVIVFMTGLAYAVHQVAEVRFAPRLKAGLARVPGLRPVRPSSGVRWIRAQDRG
jgi:peptidoglycan/LPS O-acetylase OafA/YrhL